MPFSSALGDTSRTTVGNPACALTCAMPLPIRPQPTTPTFWIAMERFPFRREARRAGTGSEAKGSAGRARIALREAVGPRRRTRRAERAAQPRGREPCSAPGCGSAHPRPRRRHRPGRTPCRPPSHKPIAIAKPGARRAHRRTTRSTSSWCPATTRGPALTRQLGETLRLLERVSDAQRAPPLRARQVEREGSGRAHHRCRARVRLSRAALRARR